MQKNVLENWAAAIHCQHASCFVSVVIYGMLELDEATGLGFSHAFSKVPLLHNNRLQITKQVTWAAEQPRQCRKKSRSSHQSTAQNRRSQTALTGKQKLEASRLWTKLLYTNTVKKSPRSNRFPVRAASNSQA